MMVWIIIFMIIATIFTLATLVYVVIDLIVELRHRKKTEGGQSSVDE